MNTGFRLRSLSLQPSILVALFAVWISGCATLLTAQSVPVPFANTAAGGGVVCANSISTYAPLAANQKLVGDGCPAAQTTFNTPVALAIDRFNNVVIADQTNDLVRVIYNGGAAMAAAIVAANAQVTGLVPQVGYMYTIVGGPQSTPTESTFYCTQTGSGIVGYDKILDGCPGVYAYIQPRGMAFDKDGNLFISSLASSYGVRVFYVGGTAIANLIALENPAMTGAPQPGYVYDIAGTGAPTNTTGGDGGLAYKATISQPRGLWIDANENVYFTDTLNGLIRRVDPTTGFISTVAGNCVAAPACPAAAAAGDGNPATSAAVKINYPYGVIFDGNGNMFIADSGSGTGAAGRVRVVYAGGTLAGISNPVVGDIYTYAGGGASSGTQAQQTTFQYVYGLSFDANGFLYINDYRNATSPGGNHVWRVDPATGNITNIAGNGGSTAQTAGGYCSNASGTKSVDARGDGCPGPQVYMNLPQQAPVFDSQGNFYIAERNTNVVRYFSYNNSFGTTPVGSTATQAVAFALPFGTATVTPTLLTDGANGTDFSDAGGDVCVGAASSPQESVCTVNVKFAPGAGGDRTGSVIVSPSVGVVATEVLTGVGSAAQVTIDPATTANLGSAIQPQGVSVDLSGNVYLSDGTGKQVLKTTIGGSAPAPVFTGLGAPRGTTTDSFGNVYVADATNNDVLQLSKAGVVTTVVTGLSGPTGMTSDGRGNVYVADTGNNRIVHYSPLSGVSNVVNVYPQTLSVPTALTVDANNNLYVLDSGNKRILEVPPAALPTVVTLPAGAAPGAFALDRAGNLYIADLNSQTLLLARTTGTTQTLQTGLTTPVGVALDTSGDVLYADATSTSVLALKRAVSTDTFATININTQSLPTALTLNSVGDVAATLGTPLFTVTGNTVDFSGTGAGTTCSAGEVLGAGASCAQSFEFTPLTTGPRAATVTFTPVAGNAVSANLSGVAINLLATTLTIAQTQPTTASVSYGQGTTFVATLSSASTTPAPTGTVTFVVDGVKQTAQTFAAGGNSLTDNLGVGTHVIAASYSGDSVYAGSNTSFSMTVTASSTTTAVSSSQSVNGVTLQAVVTPAYKGAVGLTGTVTFFLNGVSQGAQAVGNGTVSQLVSVADGTYTLIAVYSGDGNYATSTSSAGSLTVKRTATVTALTITPSANTTTVSLQLNATVTGAGGTPSGTVTFYNGTTNLGTVTLSVTGTATLPAAVGSNFGYTASYSGNGLFQPSSVVITETPDFAVLQPSGNLVVPQGQQAVAGLNVVSVASYSGALTATCSNLPVNSLCRFSPVPLTVSPGVNGNLGVEVFIGTSSTVASVGLPFGGHPGLRVLSVLFGGAMMLGLLRRRRTLMVPKLLSVLVLFVLAAGAGGCGSTNAASFQDQAYVTPTGTYPVTITLTDTNKVSHSVVLNVQVNSQ